MLSDAVAIWFIAVACSAIALVTPPMVRRSASAEREICSPAAACSATGPPGGAPPGRPPPHHLGSLGDLTGGVGLFGGRAANLPGLVRGVPRRFENVAGGAGLL